MKLKKHGKENESFDLIIHPVSNTFVPNVLPVWKEAYRVLSQHISSFIATKYYGVRNLVVN